MRRHAIPVSARQMACLGLIMLVPVALAFIFVFLAPPKPGQGAPAAAILGAVLLIIAGIFAAAVLRHGIEFRPGALTVRHSLYTLRVDRTDILDIRPLQSLAELGLSTRTNGIAAFGYFSGWFRRARGERTFCAVSALPVYLITLKESVGTRYLALSAGPELARSLEAWASER